MRHPKLKCILCHKKELNIIKIINKKPDVEVDYKIPESKYLRFIYHCSNCSVYYNYHNLLNDDIYTGQYNKSIEEGIINKRFQKIIKLNNKKSDNINRVHRINDFCNYISPSKRRIFDIGSGTCVFLYEMKKLGYKTFCIDPDPSAIEHAKEVVQVSNAYCGNILDTNININFDLITFNKVLEHIINPIDYLKKSHDLLKKDGFLYIELPEGDRIVDNDMIENRAEFAVEHFSIYNKKSIHYLIKSSEFKILKSEIITDPSGKNTIYAFAKKNN